MHEVIGLGLLITAIAFAFGQRTAQYVVGAVLITGALGFAYIMYRVISGTI